jgi:hypothetical protein
MLRGVYMHFLYTVAVHKTAVDEMLYSLLAMDTQNCSY